jgi:hypothetical protein
MAFTKQKKPYDKYTSEAMTAKRCWDYELRRIGATLEIW